MTIIVYSIYELNNDFTDMDNIFITMTPIVGDDGTAKIFRQYSDAEKYIETEAPGDKAYQIQKVYLKKS